MFAAYDAALHHLAAPEAAWEDSVATILDDREAAIRARVNATEHPVEEALLHEPLLRQALATPDRIAVIGPDATYTYDDLLRRAVAIAARIGPVTNEQLVAVAIPKGAAQIAATLSVLIAGGAYLPLDPELPAERFNRLLARTDTRTVLTTEALAPGLRVPDGIRLVATDRITPAERPDTMPPRRAAPSDLAYVIFTSGSTGEPKGVMIEHRAALNTVLDINDRFAVSPDDRVLGLSSLGFDLSVYDIFGPLARGAALVLPDAQRLRDPAHVADVLRRHDVTIWNSVPMFLRLFLEDAPDPAVLRSLRLAMLSGDWIPLDLPPALERTAPWVELFSLGGATEASIWSIVHPVGVPDPAWSSVPYGKPMRNQRFHVLDAALRPCLDGVEGDLHIGGVGLARGYWRDPERTAAAFITHPGTGERLYRTGDLGRYREGGLIEFLGRDDGQVKIGGFRVELGEIEATALGFPGIDGAVAIPGGPDRDRRVVNLYVTTEERGDIGIEAVRAHLADRLPHYMVPRHIAVGDTVPLTGNGKVDRGALEKLLARPDTPSGPAADAPSEPVAPPTPARPHAYESLLDDIGRIVAEELNVDNVDAYTSFFELGADSLTAVAVNRRMRGDLGLDSRMTDFFEHPNIDLLARRFAASNAAAPARPETGAAPDDAAGRGLAAARALARRRFRSAFLAESQRNHY